MPSHWQFGHLQPKLWAKEGPGVKLAVCVEHTSIYTKVLVVLHTFEVLGNTFFISLFHPQFFFV